MYVSVLFDPSIYLFFQPDSEDGNEMVFCDSCDICVHQVSGLYMPIQQF